MSILLLGLNHRTAPVHVREQLAFGEAATAEALERFGEAFPDSEMVLLSTCNRVELIVSGHPEPPTTDALVTFLAQARDLPVTQFRPHLYERRDAQAIRHLFRVTSGLDAMVLGDVQVVRQVRNSWAQARRAGRSGWLLNRLFHHALAASKRVRHETGIGHGRVCVSSAAADAARRVHPDLSRARVLVVGAGETSQLLCTYLVKAGVSQFLVTSRTQENAQRLADQCNGQAVPFLDAIHRMGEADIVVTATNCPHTLITAEQIGLAMQRRHGRTLYLVDLSVPRNIDPAAANLPGVLLHDVDSLGRITADNQASRQRQLPHCEAILDEEVDAFERWRAESSAKPLIEQLYRDAAALRDAELQRCLSRCDLSDSQRQAVERLAERLVNKLLHPCARVVREHGRHSAAHALTRTLHDIAQASHGRKQTAAQAHAELGTCV